MAVEPYRWFRADLNLRQTYGGELIKAGGDSAELTPDMLAHRYFCQRFGYPKNGTRFLWDTGVASGVTWVRIPEVDWNRFSSELTASELSSVVTSAPAGFTLSSNTPKLQPWPDKFNLLVIGESIPAGLGATPQDTRGTWINFIVNGIPGQNLDYSLDSTNNREAFSEDYAVLNTSLGSSSYDNNGPNASTANGAAEYPLVQSLAFNQRTDTIPMNSKNVLLCSTLLTNDLAYDLTVTPQQAWDRARYWVDRVRARNPLTQIQLNTTGKRGELAPLNSRIGATNDLMRDGYAAEGVDFLGDIEALIPELNLVTGDTNNKTFFTDGTHWTSALHMLAADALRPNLIEARRRYISSL